MIEQKKLRKKYLEKCLNQVKKFFLGLSNVNNLKEYENKLSITFDDLDLQKDIPFLIELIESTILKCDLNEEKINIDNGRVLFDNTIVLEFENKVTSDIRILVAFCNSYLPIYLELNGFEINDLNYEEFLGFYVTVDEDHVYLSTLNKGIENYSYISFYI